MKYCPCSQVRQARRRVTEKFSHAEKRSSAQNFHDGIEVDVSQSLLHAGNQIQHSHRDGIGDKAIFDMLLFQLFTQRAGQGKNIGPTSTSSSCVFRADCTFKITEIQISVVWAVVFDHHFAKAGALCPADVAHSAPGQYSQKNRW